MNAQVKATAKILKASLKAKFPTVDFSVRQGNSSSHYAINVEFTAQLPLTVRGMIDEICIAHEFDGLLINNYQVAAK